MVEFHVMRFVSQYIIGLKIVLYNVQGSNSKVTLFTQIAQKCYVQNFLGETLNLAVLDSGCT